MKTGKLAWKNAGRTPSVASFAFVASHLRLMRRALEARWTLKKSARLATGSRARSRRLIQATKVVTARIFQLIQYNTYRAFAGSISSIFCARPKGLASLAQRAAFVSFTARWDFSTEGAQK